MAFTKAGPSRQPCLSCKRRRVKCDAAKPGCERCHKDGMECPGYVRIREWSVQPKARSMSILKSTKDDSSDQEPVRRAQSSVVTVDSQADPLMAHMPSWLLSPDTENLLILDCIRYYNQRQIPSRMPAEPPFNRQRYQLVYRNEWPKLFRQLIIVTVRTGQCVTNRTDPLANAEICHYRARSLAELKGCIGQAVFEPHGFTLAYVIMFLVAEVVNPASGSWRYHLEAARKIMTLRGGFAKCFQLFPAPRSLLVNYMMIDAYTATTCSTSFLDRSSMETQLDYFNSTLVEEEIMSNGSALSQDILRNVIHTTLLRISQRDIKKLSEKPFTPPQDFAAILESIENFDPLSWANRVAWYGRMHPEKRGDSPSAGFIAGWFALATCQKSAAFLYLLLSCTSPEEEAVIPKIHSAKEALWKYSRLLLDTSSLDDDSPAEAQLWKFLSWPMLVSAYARIGWDIGEESVEEAIGRLQEIVKGTDRWSLLLFSDVLANVRAERNKNPDGVLQWDDCLDSRLFA